MKLSPTAILKGKALMHNGRMLFIFFLLTCTVFGQENYIESVRDKSRIVGLTYAVFTSDQVLELGALGKRRIDAEDEVLTTDRFHIGSNTKAITAFFAAKLVEQKKIYWNTKYFDVFPELRKASRKEYFNITIQDLLSHRAGIAPYRSVNANRDIYKIPGSSTEQKVKFAATVLKEAPVKPSDGQAYVYSNAGISLAASMLEKVSGKSWEELVKENLNGFEVGFPNVRDASQPWGHILNENKIIALPPEFDYRIASVMRPSGDLNVSIIDYIKFIQLFQNGYHGEDNVLRSETYKYMLTALPEYTFGWANKTIDGVSYNFHSGSAATFGCFVKIDRDNDKAAIVMANFADGDALNAIQQIADHLLKKYSDK